MTQDELVERVAQEAQDHMEQHHGIVLAASQWDALARAIIPIVQAEQRERDAAIADDHGEAWGLSYVTMTNTIATAIRNQEQTDGR